MKNKIMFLSLLTLGICSMAQALEYKSPEVGFKARSAPSKEMKTADFGDHYRVETGAMTDRQIASEESDREPSSVLAKEKKKVVPKHEPEVVEEPISAPKPWMRDDFKSNMN